MKFLFIILTTALLTACAGPFSFTGENANKGFVVFSTGVSDQCDELDKFNVVLGYIRGLDGQAGRAFNLRNPLLSYDFEEYGSTVYSFPMEPGRYSFNHLSILESVSSAGPGFKKDTALIPYNVEVEAGKINYFGNLVYHGQEESCKENRYKIEVINRKDRDFAVVAEDEPLLFGNQ